MSTSGDSSIGGSSVSGASENTDTRALNDLGGRDGAAADDSVADLLQQNKGIQEAIFASLHTLTKNRSSVSTRNTLIRIVVEFLQLFLLCFNRSMTWNIQGDLWVYKAFSWLLFRFAVLDKTTTSADLGYSVYLAVFYVVAIAILLTVGLTVCVTLIMRRAQSAEGPWMRRLVAALQYAALLIFGVFWVVIFDYVAFLFDCDWTATDKGAPHMTFGNSCLAMPHVAHMAFAGFVIVVHAAATFFMSLADCELNPMTKNLSASPAAGMHFKVLALKMIIIVVSAAMDAFDGVQPAILLTGSILICYLMFLELPYFCEWVNHLWFGLWFGIFYTCALLVASDARRDDASSVDALTWGVLYGIFPVVLAGIALSCGRLQLAKRPLKDLVAAFNDPAMHAHLKIVYRFKDQQQVELLARVVRKWDEDGVPDEQATALGEFIIKAGMARFPNSPFLLVLYANFMIEARKDGQTSRTQLQVAAKNNPTLFDRYFAFVCQALSKELLSGDCVLDLLGYVEFQRNYRACVKSHKLALAGQRHFWHSLLRDKVPFADLQRAFVVMEQAETQATEVYKRVMERYPNSGRLVKIYGRFLEFVCNDPWAAARQYQEAMRLGLTDNILGMAAGGAIDDDAATARLTSLAGAIDEKEDCLIIINADGIILMMNRAGYRMFGYAKGELEGKNVSCLMPAPYSQHHNGYLSHYAATGQSKLLDRTRQMVALNKDRAIFPINIMATKLSGSGSDATFMAIIRTVKEVAPSAAQGGAVSSAVRVWCSTTGIVLCAEQRITDVLGIPAQEVVGRPLSSMGADIQAMDKFILGAAVSGASDSDLVTHARLLHKYLPPVEVELRVDIQSAEQNLLIVSISAVGDIQDSTMVVDRRGRICWGTSQLAELLGYPLKTLLGLELQAIMPPPYAQLHRNWMKDPSVKPPAASCRTPGRVVHLLTSNNNQLPVTLQMTSHDDGESTKHVVKVTKADNSMLLDQRRLLLTLDQYGRVMSINSGATKAVFGFNPSLLVGKHLRDFIDVFGEWLRKYAEDDSLLGLIAQERGGASFRVGVLPPRSHRSSAGGLMSHRNTGGGGLSRHVSNGAALAADMLARGSAGGAAPDGVSVSLLATLAQAQEKVKPAVIVFEPIVQSDDEQDDAAAVFGGVAADAPAEPIPVLEVQLWAADMLAAVMEVDAHLVISRADATAGLLFGLAAKALLRKRLASLVPLPGAYHASDLFALADSGAHNKKGLMKSGGAWQVGPTRVVEATHANGGAPIKLQLQAVMKDVQQGHGRAVLRLQVLNASQGSLEVMEALRAGHVGAQSLKLKTVADSSEDEEDVTADAGVNGLARQESRPARPHSPELHERLDSRLRTSTWVETTSVKRRSHIEAAAGDAHAVLSIAPSDKSKAWKAKLSDAGSEPTGKGSHAGSAVSGDDAVSVHSGMGATSEADMSSMAAGEEDLTADWRRAKRLKRLTRLMTSSTAQAASHRFGSHTKVLLAVMLAVHFACFMVLVIQVQDKNENSRIIERMAYTVDNSQRLAMRATMIFKCQLPDFVSMPVCQPAQINFYITRQTSDTITFSSDFQGLYLGLNKLAPFKDPRLQDFWTFSQLPQVTYVDVYNTNYTADKQAQNSFVQSSATLWDMGNTVFAASEEMLFLAPVLGARINATSSYQYIINNAPASLFKGLSWSMDTFTDYCFQQLALLSVITAVLLAVEAVIALLLCMAWQFVLLKTANSEHIRRFSVFLALPSATIRAMAMRQGIVDDDDANDDADDEDMEEVVAAEAAAAAAGRASQAKSVRMDAGAPHDDDAGKGTAGKFARQGTGALNQVTGRGPGTGGRSAKTGGILARNARRSALGRLSKAVDSMLLGWVQTKFKVNGKKLLPNDSKVTRIMVPLLLWATVVLIMYGVSLNGLANLQGPLTSLDAAAHVLYRGGRAIAFATNLAFAQGNENNAAREALAPEIDALVSDYQALVYGGNLNMQANVSFNTKTPASAFSSAAISNLFFKTTDCLRADQSTCLSPDNEMYTATRHGLDTIVKTFIEQCRVMLAAPNEINLPNHPAYEALQDIGMNDLRDGLRMASALFVDFTLGKFNQVLQLHIILLVITICSALAFVLFLYMPYTKHLRVESKKIAGMLSQLPAEVDVEGHVRTVVLGIRRDESSRASMKAGQSSMAMFASSGPAHSTAIAIHTGGVGFLTDDGNSVASRR